MALKKLERVTEPLRHLLEAHLFCPVSKLIVLSTSNEIEPLFSNCNRTICMLIILEHIFYVKAYCLNYRIRIMRTFNPSTFPRRKLKENTFDPALPYFQN